MRDQRGKRYGEYSKMIYKPGDEIEGLGIIDTNHCGLPWLASMNGIMMGVLQIKHRGAYFIDAKTGKRIQGKRLEKRLNNRKYDYDNRMQLKKKECKTYNNSE